MGYQIQFGTQSGAPTTNAIGQVLKKHTDLRALVDNQWIHLLRMNDAVQVDSLYARGHRWRPRYGDPFADSQKKQGSRHAS